jgi:hypothetical protein
MTGAARDGLKGGGGWYGSGGINFAVMAFPLRWGGCAGSDGMKPDNALNLFPLRWFVRCLHTARTLFRYGKRNAVSMAPANDAVLAALQYRSDGVRVQTLIDKRHKMPVLAFGPWVVDHSV